ncbi:MAG: hypothetical protein JRC90_11755, partial [Deltaproteobacteria bacterium]|nr:hypothetical protein [Deltaproteobacteria bacterium]
ILVSTGWNNNDDVFTCQETWAARLTPEDKPFNVGHKPRQIIGHITANTVVDDDLVVIADDIPFEDIPDKFHILTSAVVYRHINSKDETLEAEAAELIESIKNGDWFVSMECLFGGFDYGVTHANGEQQIVTRTDATAFLTKHLRRYGGCGEYNGGKLGRVLKNITFSGKGLVENPANPESVIVNDTKRFVGVIASDFIAVSEQEQILVPDPKQGETNMADEKYTGQLEDQIKGLQADLAAANTKVDELGEAQVKSALAEKSAEITTLEADLKAAQAKIDELTASFNDAVKAKDTAEAARADVDTQLAEATTKLTEVEAIAKTTARVAILVDKGIDKADAETVAAEFNDLDDDKFAKVVEMKSEAAKAPKDDTNDEGNAEAGEEPESDPEGEAAAGDADLENAEPDEDPAMGSDEGEASQDELMTSLAAYLDTSMHGDAGK